MPLRLSAAALLAALASCAPASGQAGHLPPTHSAIVYETGPCFGTCPVYRVELLSNGAGTFTGERFTAVTGERRFEISPAQYRAFAARLAPHRPDGELTISHGHPRCGLAATDMPSATVTWREQAGVDRLSYYYGCRGPGNEALAEALREAPGMLPIGEFIGSPGMERLPR
ncbi:MAG: hypothetical protein H7X93_08285 [Sphingomonadaceae bacterium]|nr:hypothetical protein [Sphingomonadaceae bacterium]